MTDLPGSAVPYPALQLDAEGRVTALNDLASALFPPSAIGRPAASLFAEGASLPAAPGALAGWLGAGRALTILDADGQARYQARVQPWRGGGLLVLVDLTLGGRRQQVGVDLLAKAVDAANNSIVLADLRAPDQPLVYANEWFLQFTGYTREEVLGRNCRFLQFRDGDRDDAAGRQADALDAIRHGVAEAEHVGGVVLRNYTKDGRLFYNELYLTPIRDETGTATHMIGVQNDVTQRIEAQAEREREAERLRSLFAASAAPLGLVERGDGGALVHTLRNDAADALCLPPDTFDGAPSQALWTRAAGEAARTRAPVRFDVDCGGRTFEVLLAPVEGDGPALDRFLYVAADVTAGRAAAEDLLEVSNRQLRRIAQDVHDGVGQSLAGASMMASALAADLAGSAHAENAERLQRLLLRTQTQLRSFALGLDPIDIDRVGMSDALRRLAADARAVLDAAVTVDDRAPGLRLRDDLVLDVYRVAQEALTNAVRHGSARAVAIRLDRVDGGAFQMTLTDDGTGITREAAERGGMGLRTMRARAQRHGGSVAIGPAEGGGTRVRLRVPLEAGP